MQCYKCKVGLPNGAQFCLSCGAAQYVPKKPFAARFVATIGLLMTIVGGAIIVGLIVIVMVVAFEGGNRSFTPRITSVVVVDEHKLLKDGESWAWHLTDGNYGLELTASDGVTVEWLGGNCPKTEPMLQLTTACRLSQDGQLIIRNPTIFGLGPGATVTVKVTRSGF